MFTLHKFGHRTGNLGKPLPDPFELFDRRRVKFRIGGTSLIAGTPGSFKSIFALNMLTKWAQDRSVLYFSADSDEFTVAKRLASILTNDTNDTVEERMSEPGDWRDHYVNSLRAVDGARFVYNPLSFETIQTNLAAFEEVNHAFPEVVFVDNLIDTVEDPDDWGGMIHFIKQMDILSRETRSHVCILHHASESWAQSHPGLPPPSAFVQGKVNQIPRMVLTMAAEDSQWLRIACVKNTNGPMDATAKSYMEFRVEPSLRVEAF